jgi:isoleucyl-tRNA synthetase
MDDGLLAEAGRRIDREGFRDVMGLIPAVAKALEEKRGQGAIGSSFDAKIKLLTKNAVRYKVLESLRPELCEIFKVSQVELGKSESDFSVEAGKADGAKCARCWNYSAQTGMVAEHPLLCPNCLKAIGGKS